MQTTTHAPNCCGRMTEALASGVSRIGAVCLLLRKGEAGGLFYKISGEDHERHHVSSGEPILFCMFCGADLCARRAVADPIGRARMCEDEDSTVLASGPTPVLV